MKKYILHFLSMATVGLLVSCSDFLDVAPKDKVLEEDQFSTEAGVNGALNGLYRQMISTSLYGATLSQTTLDAMGHFYTYPPSLPSGNFLSTTLYYLCNGDYDNDNVRSIFNGVWQKGYTTLFNINHFLESMEKATAVMSQDNRNVLMGEAYGLRAYLHFDLFRLFGPRWEQRSPSKKILPYNRSTDVILNHQGYEETVYSTADEYMDFVLEDIKVAERLLKADPICSDANSISQSLISDFYKNRNRRMNYYALKALKARVLQYIGDYANAAIAAKAVTDEVGENKRFQWTDVTKVLSNRDYSFFHEIVFGINNPDMLSNFDNFYGKTELSSLYAVDHDHLLQNIFTDAGGNLDAVIDVRAKQWTKSNDQGGSSLSSSYSKNGTYISNKFNIPSNNNLQALADFQPLIRISEMYYIQAEAALKKNDCLTAAKMLNDISSHRGIPETSDYYLTEDDTEDAFHSHIMIEYYREFYGEGQVFFYLKRLNSEQMFPGYGGEAININTEKIYNLPIPKVETDI